MSKNFFVAAAEAGDRTGEAALLPGVLRYVLLFRDAPDLPSVQKNCEDFFEGAGFDLFRPPHSDDPNLLVLQFPGVRADQSTSYLMSTARELTDQLDAESCEVDASPGWSSEDELGRAARESSEGSTWSICRSSAAAPASPQWSVGKVLADKAWESFSTQGEGIRVAQPDTGVAQHSEVDDAVDLNAGADIITGNGRPIDPLDSKMANPGHGTATASVVASRTTGIISGTAPKATLVPIRCVNSVVLSSGIAVAGAIDHARREKCHVVTMSLGGPVEFKSLKRALQRAVDDHMIVLAAAGNCVRLVVYPAWDQNVISVAATNFDDMPWRGSSRGTQVDVSAPGENVYVARRTLPTDVDTALVEPGQGTSFAVATTAGCAALWLQHHGVDLVRTRAEVLGVRTQHLFLAALMKTARVPSSWNAGAMGAGVVDAAKLLGLALEDIGPDDLFYRSKTAPVGVLPETFDWDRLGPELTFLEFQAAQRRDPYRRYGHEFAMPALPSAELVAALPYDDLRALTPVLSPALVGPRTPEKEPIDALKLIVSGSPASRPIVGAAEAEAKRYLSGSGKTEILDALHAQLSGRKESDDVEEWKAKILDAAPTVIEDLAAGRAKATIHFTGVARFAAEALVKLTGRPALRIVNGAVDKNDPRIGEWAADLVMARNALRPIVNAVCRVDVLINGRWEHVGTGTHVGGGRILTNRHVMDALAEVLPSRTSERRYELTIEASVIFDDAGANDDRRFSVVGIGCAGPDRIGGAVNNSLLDLAVLLCETTNASKSAFPAAAPSGDFSEKNGRKQLALVGYPAKPDWQQLIDPGTGEVSDEIGDALHVMFGGEYSVKYLSPGEVMRDLGEIDDGGRNWVFSHDATSLPGSSGSSVIALGAKPTVAGLHFGGSPLTQNLAHSLAAVRRVAREDRRLLGSADIPF